MADRKLYLSRSGRPALPDLPLEVHRDRFEAILGCRIHRNDWWRFCRRVRHYLEELTNLDAGIPKSEFREKALKFAGGLGAAVAIWKSLTPEDLDLLLDAGLYNRGGEVDKAIFVSSMPAIDAFAKMVPEAIEHWDSQNWRPFDMFAASMWRDLERMGVAPSKRTNDPRLNEFSDPHDEDFEPRTIIARFAHALINEYLQAFREQAEPLSRTGAKSVGAMERAIGRSRTKGRKTS